MVVRNIPTPEGRIFAMGDLHGQRHLLEAWLDWVDFDFDRDILLSPGDLIDRGVDSLWCARLIYEPWLHVSNSNHGVMFSETMRDMESTWAGSFISNGGAWVLPLMGDDELQSLAMDMGKLPYVLNIRNHAGELFHIIHSELNDGSITGDNLQDDEWMAAYLADPRHSHPIQPNILWGRDQFGDFYGKQLDHRQIVGTLRNRPGGAKGIFNLQNDNRGHIISGHTILQRPLTILNQTCLDTGSFIDRTWSGVTFMDLDTRQTVRSGMAGVVPVERIIITKEDLL